MNKKYKWTDNNTLNEVLRTPIGNEIFSFLTYYSGKSIEDIDKLFIRSLPLKSYRIISRLTGIELDNQLIRWIIDLLNEQDKFPVTQNSNAFDDKKWWKKSVIYHIFVPSFYDSNQDGYGDIRGIINKFEYFLSLNVNCLLLSPIFASPFIDAGYDVSNYYEINHKLGTIKDIQELIALCKHHKIKLVLTFPLNQTSDQHGWFKNISDFSKDKETHSFYKDYYINNEIPNNWQSMYNDSAWSYLRNSKSYYLSLKSKNQIDLNWKNPKIRQEMIKAMQYWQRLGIDGLFLESSGIIAKDPHYHDGNKIIANLTGISGVEQYTYRPELFTYLEEIFHKLKDQDPNFLLISDNQRTHKNIATMVSGDNTKKSDLGFHYIHFENPGQHRFQSNNVSLAHLSITWFKMQEDSDSSYWPVLFCEDPNHTRIVSRIPNHSVYRTQIAKLIATLQLTGKGTIIIYQGQELAQVNAPFHSMRQIRDIESINKFEELNEKPEIIDTRDTFEHIIRGSRDHARVPIAWNDSLHNGFSTANNTWIDCFADPGMNVQDQTNDSHSVLNFVRSLISLRSHFQTLVFGKIYSLSTNNKNNYRVLRYDKDHAFYIEANLTDDSLNIMGISKKLIEHLQNKGKIDMQCPENIDETIFLCNYPDRNQQDLIKNSELRPYETFIIKLY